MGYPLVHRVCSAVAEDLPSWNPPPPPLPSPIALHTGCTTRNCCRNCWNMRAHPVPALLQVFWSNRSAAYCSLKEYEKALEDANRAIALKPAWAKAYSRQAAALHGLQRYEASIEAAEKGLELDPNSVQLQRSLEMVRNEFEKAAKNQKTESEAT